MSQCTLCYFISSEMKFTLNITKLFAFSQLNTLSIWNYSARSYQGPSASSLHFQQVASHIRLTHSTNVPGDMTSTNLFSNILSFDIDSTELNCIKKRQKVCWKSDVVFEVSLCPHCTDQGPHYKNICSPMLSHFRMILNCWYDRNLYPDCSWFRIVRNLKWG